MKEINLFNSGIKVQLEHLKKDEIWAGITKREKASDTMFYYNIIAEPQFSITELEYLVSAVNSFIQEVKSNYPEWYKKAIPFDENLVGKKVISKSNPKDGWHEVVSFFVYQKCKYITIARVVQAENRHYEFFHKFAIVTESEFYQDFEVID